MSNALGVIGMGIMGLNLAMNAAEKGFKVAVYNRTTSRMESAVATAAGQSLKLDGHATLEAFIQSLERPRKVLILVQAGAPVDATLDQVLALVQEGDIVIDCGNEFYANTERRQQLAQSKNVHFFGMGVSGGEEGARHGPSLMPGGTKEVYDLMEPILTKIAAQSSAGHCVDFIGNGSAGNYVKMVHNGIEYGDMQLIAEAYAILRYALNIGDLDKVADVFKGWNSGRMNSYLIEITEKVLRTSHPEIAGMKLIDDVLDVAGSKGTGKWTVQEAIERGTPCPTIQAALDARYMSGLTAQRDSFYERFAANEENAVNHHLNITTADIETALYLSKLCSYAQGIELIKKASEEKGYGVNIARIAKCWTGGCIIRAKLLEDIMKAYSQAKQPANLLLAEEFAAQFTASAVNSWKQVVAASVLSGIATPAMAASLNYFQTLCTRNSSLNVIQAQRDFFGGHTFRLKSDRSSVRHANWEKGVFAPVP